MSTGDTRTIIVNEQFVDTFPVFAADGHTKVSGLPQSNFTIAFRFNGEIIPAPVFVFDEPDDDGEYRIQVAAGELDQLGFYQIEVLIQSNLQIWAVGIQSIDNLMDVIQGIFMGTEQVNIDVVDAVPAPITDVIVQVFDSGMSRLIQGGRTNQPAGRLTTTLDPGTYKVILSKSLTSFTNPYTITVADTGGLTPQTFTLVGVPLSISPPASPQFCRVYGYLQSMTGQYSDKYNVQISGVGSGDRSYVAGTGAIDAEPQGVAKDHKVIRPSKTTGIWEIDLVRGTYVRIQIESQSIDKVFRVPDASMVNFRDIDTLDTGGFIGSALGAASPFEVPRG